MGEEKNVTMSKNVNSPFKNIWRVIMFDQRGAGKSTPFADLRDNTTWDTVADMEKIRETLKIDKWALFGGCGIRAAKTVGIPFCSAYLMSLCHR